MWAHLEHSARPQLGEVRAPGTQLTIERQQRKLLETHYNDAVGIDTLRTEQKRHDTEPTPTATATTRSLNALRADLTEADRLISIVLDIAQHAGNA